MNNSCLRKIISFIILYILLSNFVVGNNDYSQYRFHPIASTPYYHGFQNVVKDSIGRLWYNGRDALFMFDGNTHHEMGKAMSNISSSNDWVYNHLILDASKQIIVATNYGLLEFNYSSKKFKLLTKGFVNSIAQDREGDLWIIRDNQVELISTKTGEISRSYKMPNDNSPIATIHKNILYNNGFLYFVWKGNIYKVNKNLSSPILCTNERIPNVIQMVRHKNILYVLSEKKGIYVLDNNGDVTRIIDPRDSKLQASSLKRMFIDMNDVLWIGSQHGLYLYNLKTEQKKVLKSDVDDSYSLPHSSVWSINPDANDGVWISTFGGSIVYMSFSASYFDVKKVAFNGLNNSIVSCFAEDRHKNIWIGTEGGGVNKWDRLTDKFSYYTHDTKGLASNLIKDIAFDKEKNDLIVASYNGGLQKISAETNQITTLELYYPHNLTSKFNAYTFTLEADSGIWVADTDKAQSLYYKNIKDGIITPIPLDSKIPDRPKYSQVESMWRSIDGYLYLLTQNGLFKLDVRTKKVIHQYLIDTDQPSINNLRCFAITSDGNVWIGTKGGGLNLFSKDGKYTNVGKKQGFQPSTIFSIIEDPVSKDIWFATEDGIWVYNFEKQKYSRFTFLSTESRGAFYPRSIFRTSQGELLIGCTKGFVYFNPQKYKVNQKKAEVFFTRLYINSEKVLSSDPKSVLSKDISVLNGNKKERIALSYKESNVRVDFSSDSYLQPELNVYACRLQGASRSEWQVLPEGQTYVEYSNLPPGEYKLEVKAANNNGIWGDKISSLYFEVASPPWLSVWAILVYGFVAFIASYLIWKYFTDRKIFHLKLEAEKAKEAKMQELIQTRINFFTNISHDLKTPLSLIVNPLKRLQENFVKESDTEASMHTMRIEDNVKRIQRLIDQLLQFRQIESKKLTLNYTSGYIVKHIKNIFNLFEYFIDQKEIRTDFELEYGDLFVQFDYDVIEKIFSNLFSNAVKYTPKGGEIKLRLRRTTDDDIARHSESIDIKNQKDQSFFTFDVTNTGVEISAEQQKELFSSFSRLTNEEFDFGSSHGLGLSIVHELVTMIGGFIFLDNSVSQEITFSVVLPLKMMKVEDADANSYSYEYTASELIDIEETIEEERSGNTIKRNLKKYDILIVDDNASLRKYMDEELSSHYNVYTAENGVEGLAMVRKVNPKLIITDLMMPEMDGFDFCNLVKSDPATANIPVIVLSALGNNTGHKLEALKEGADVFIEKPFDILYLLQQVENLIKSHETLRDFFSTKYIIEPTNVEVASTDDDLLKRITELAEKNIQNEDYDVESFVQDLGMSRTLLYQKVKELTGMSIKEFILDMRLKRSAQLLTDSEYTVSQIAYLTGFSDASYFSVCFKKYHGVSPSQFRKGK